MTRAICPGGLIADTVSQTSSPSPLPPSRCSNFVSPTPSSLRSAFFFLSTFFRSLTGLSSGPQKKLSSGGALNNPAPSLPSAAQSISPRELEYDSFKASQMSFAPYCFTLFARAPARATAHSASPTMMSPSLTISRLYLTFLKRPLFAARWFLNSSESSAHIAARRSPIRSCRLRCSCLRIRRSSSVWPSMTGVLSLASRRLRFFCWGF
mmetsp:Transcript_11745/g.36172  ORF Transcript_11745/g.36172 Transcript_11745/m.36172 type:complete len:209 (-) Transcript_11745:290-916(-)